VDKGERKVRGRKGGNTILANSAKKKKKRKARKKKTEPSTFVVGTPASSAAEPVHTEGETQGTEPASLQVGEPKSVPWTKVVGRKNRGKGSRVGKLVTPQTPKGPSLPPSGKGLEKRIDPLKATKRKVKRTAAVVITEPDSYGKAMALARQRINLEEFGIEGLRVRRAFSGGIILEIPGERADAQASYLATSLRMLFAEAEKFKDIRVAVPTQTSSLRLNGVEDSITDEEVRSCVAEAGGCSPKEIHLGKWFVL
jgi:hypothetical protein